MSRANQYYDGSVHVKVGNEEYDVDLTATAYYYYSPGTMYRRNGDPGDPPEEEFSVENVDINEVYDEEGNAITDEAYKSIADKILDACYDYLEDNPDLFEYDRCCDRED